MQKTRQVRHYNSAFSCRIEAMRLSRFHLATTREAPADAEIVSHKLMLRAGMIRKLASAFTHGRRWACASCARSRPWCARK
jgi:hypothetical protein